MKYGIAVPNFGEFAAGERLLNLALAANACGWNGFFLWDHALWRKPFKTDLHDPWLLLAAIATRTRSRPAGCDKPPMRIGTLVTPLARRKPAELARQVVTLDHLSRGRVTLGVGLGGLQEELVALGEATEEQERAALVDESLSILRLLWRGKTVNVNSAYTYRGLRLTPTPLQRSIPIWSGGLWRGRPGSNLIARAAKLDGAVLLGVDGKGRTETPRTLTVAEFERVVAEIRELRVEQRLRTRYDFAVWNDTSGSDEQEYEELGADWWIEAPRRSEPPEATFNEMWEIVLAGRERLSPGQPSAGHTGAAAPASEPLANQNRAPLRS